MANVLVYLIHPNPESLNGATAKGIAQALKADGHQVELRDLYQLGFDPRLTQEDFAGMAEGKIAPGVQAEQAAISAADGIVFAYPTWWWGRPAMLKGFFDRVFSFGFAWRYGEKGVEGLLGDKRVFAAVTHGAPRELYESMGADLGHFHDQLKVGTLGFCGVQDVEVFTSYGIPMGPSDQVVTHVEEATTAARAFFSTAK